MVTTTYAGDDGNMRNVVDFAFLYMGWREFKVEISTPFSDQLNWTTQ
jgi:hypothetical protein